MCREAKMPFASTCPTDIQAHRAHAIPNRNESDHEQQRSPHRPLTYSDNISNIHRSQDNQHPLNSNRSPHRPNRRPYHKIFILKVKWPAICRCRRHSCKICRCRRNYPFICKINYMVSRPYHAVHHSRQHQAHWNETRPIRRPIIHHQWCNRNAVMNEMMRISHIYSVSMKDLLNI